MSGYRIEYIPLAELKAWPRNPKLHAKEGLTKSMERFGFVAPLVIDEGTGQLVAGHGRLESLSARKSAGQAPPPNIRVKDREWLVPVVRGIKFKNEAEAEGYLIADNRLTEKGGWNTEVLAEILKSLPDNGLAGSGFELADVKALLKEAGEASKAVVGKTPEELLPGFLAADTKQVVLYFEADKYDAFVARMEKARETLNAKTFGETLVKLIAKYEADLAAS